jgi:hypothetical protein
MKKTSLLILLSFLFLTGCGGTDAPPPTEAPPTSAVPPVITMTERPPSKLATVPDWVRVTRLGTASSEDWDEWTTEVNYAVENGANTILGWDHFQGTNWQTLYEPALSEALAETQKRAKWIHETHPGVRYIIYMAPLETTIYDMDENGDGEVDSGKEELSIAYQHPDWAQVGVDARPAIFYGSQPDMPFWVCPTCEDIWLTPANPEFRALVVNQIQRLAAETELDGIWHDVPFLMGGYFGEGWQEGQFADLSTDARALFNAETGYTLPEPPFTPSWDDENWQRFIAWRYELMNSYLNDIQNAVSEINPEFAFIPETSVGFNAYLTQVAANPVSIPAYSQTTAHELSGTERPAQYYSWLYFLSTLQSWKHLDLAYGEPSWLLSYVEAGHDDTLDIARLHAATTELSGFRTLTSGDEGMTAEVDSNFYRDLYMWMDKNGAPLADSTLRPYANVALVFSQQTLDFVGRGTWEDEYYANFYGTQMILLESHIPYEVIPDSNLARINEFDAVILAGVEAISDAQAEVIRAYVNEGGKILATGYTSLRDEYGNERDELALADVFGATLSEISADEGVFIEHQFGAGYAYLSPEMHEQGYFWEADPENNEKVSSADGAEDERLAFLGQINRLGVAPTIQTDAASTVVLLPYRSSSGDVQVAVINFTGVGTASSIPEVQNFSIILNASENATLSWLELLESPETLAVTSEDGDQIAIQLRVNAGGVLRIMGE